MLRIGFTKKYYTLWSISETETAEKITTHYRYIQNLSYDLDDAKEKAISLGCTNLEVDNDLFGRKESWSFETLNYCQIPEEKLGFIESPKHGIVIFKTTDKLDYLLWLFSKNHKSIHLTERLVKEGLIKYVNQYDIYVNSSDYDSIIEQINLENEIKTKGEITITFTKNLNSDGSYYIFPNLGILFPSYVERYYSGYTYGLPMDKKTKKGKLIKNKSVKLTFLTPSDYNYKSDDLYTVKDFEILKN